MSTVRDRLLGSFEPGLRPHIVEFAKQVSAIDTDVVVLMARKAACFVDALHEAGLLALRGHVTSERALDMDLGWVRGKSVTVVDDVLVSGSSLYSAQTKLLAAGASRVHLVVLSVDRDNDAHLVDVGQGHLHVSAADSVRLCTQIVQAIALVPRPYNVDWPMLDDLTLPISQLGLATNLPAWNVNDVSSDAQEASKVLALTLEATGPIAERLDRSLGWPISKIASLVKLRLYAYRGVEPVPDAPLREPTDHDRMRLKAMPIVSLRTLRTIEVSSLFDTISANSPMVDPTTWAAIDTPEARLRLLQFVISARLGEVWRSDVEAITNLEGSTRLAPTQVGYAFPPTLVSQVRRLCWSPDALLEGAPDVEPEPDLPITVKTSERFQGFDAVTVQARLAEPFLALYENVELKARAALKAGGKDALADPELLHLTNRLRTGLRFEELVYVAGSSSNNTEVTSHQDSRAVQSFVSNFIDVAVDHGVIVPIIEQRGDLLLRTYRHGEDVNFAQSETRLAGMLLDSLGRALKAVVLPTTVVEKALVLMVRHGIAESWLTQFYGRLGTPGTVGIRPDLHGAVVHVGSKDHFGHREDSSLAHMLAAAGVLAAKRGGYVVTGLLPEAPTQKPSESRARALGAKLGELLLENGGSSLLSLDDLKLIATMPTARDVPLALAAEVEIFHRRWAFQQSRGFSIPSSGGPAWRSFDKALESDTTFVALQSGVEKYRAFQSDAVTRIIEQVSEGLPNESERLEWQARWEALRADESGPSTRELRLVTDRLGQWLVRAEIAMLLLRVSRAAAAPGTNAALLVRARIREAEALLPMLTGQSKTGAINQIREARRAFDAKASNIEVLIRPLMVSLQDLHDAALPLLDAARATAGHFGRALEITTYTAAGILDLGPADETVDRSRLTSILTRRKKLGTRSRVVVDILPEDPFHPDRVVVLFRGDGAGRQLSGLVADAFELSEGQSVGVTAIPDLQLVLPVFKTNGTEFHADALLSLLDRLMPRPRERRRQLRVIAPINSGLARGLLSDVDARARYSIPTSGVTAQIRGLPENWEETIVLPGPSQRRHVDVGVLTILPEEHRAVLAALGTTDVEEVRDNTGRRITIGLLPRPSSAMSIGAGVETGEPQMVVACTQAADQGPASIQAAYNALQDSAHPTFTVLMGIAGGIHDDLDLGDVVIADQVICYDRRAENADGNDRRANIFRLHIRLQHAINDYRVRHGDYVAGAAGQFKIHVGPIGSGQAVIRSPLAETRQWLRSVNDKTLAVEMEAEGVATAAREAAREDTYIVLRGISDHADENKCASDRDGSRERASENAMTALCLLAPFLVSARAVPLERTEIDQAAARSGQ